MANVTPGYTFTGPTDPVTAAKLNLLGQPTITLGSGEVTPSNMSPSGVGYATGAGGTVTQGTNRTTGVVLNKATGAITLFSAAGSATPATFTVSNSLVAAADVPIVVQKSGTDKYEIFVTNVVAGAFNITSFTTGGTTTEQPIFSFVIFKGAIS